MHMPKHEPTPAEILEATAAIRREWSDLEHVRRTLVVVHADGGLHLPGRPEAREATRWYPSTFPDLED